MRAFLLFLGFILAASATQYPWGDPPRGLAEPGFWDAFAGKTHEQQARHDAWVTNERNKWNYIHSLDASNDGWPKRTPQQWPVGVPDLSFPGQEASQRPVSVPDLSFSGYNALNDPFRWP